jgi:thiamine monophosphate kinase
MAKVTSAGTDTLALLTNDEADALAEALRYLLTFSAIGTNVDTDALARVREALDDTDAARRLHDVR